MKKRLTLTETMALHKVLGKQQLGFKINGEVEVKIVNADGSVDQVIKQENLVTRLWHMVIQLVKDLTTMNVFIADDFDVMDEERTAFRISYASASLSDDRSLDATNFVWTYQTTLSAPSSDRAFQIVGLALTGNVLEGGPAYSISNVIAATKLTSPLTQTTIQTLQITYRLSFARV